MIVPKPDGGEALPSVLNPELVPAPEMDTPPNRDAIVKPTPARRNYAWALLMMRVFLLDVLQLEPDVPDPGNGQGKVSNSAATTP